MATGTKRGTSDIEMACSLVAVYLVRFKDPRELLPAGLPGKVAEMAGIFHSLWRHKPQVL